MNKNCRHKELRLTYAYMIDPFDVIQQHYPPTVRTDILILGYSSSGEHKQPGSATTGRRAARAIEQPLY